MVTQNTHYQVLEISKGAELIDIKKAYRRLALKHHPDRNNGSTESTEKFKEISRAYTILSDPTTRRNYDVSLRSTPQTSVSSTPYASASQQQRQHTQFRGVRDPYQQFDDLFRNDPFFQEAFQDMDDVFAKRFDNSQDQKRDDVGSPGILGLFPCGIEKQNQPAKNVTWSQWLMNKLGIEFEMTSISHQADGSVVTSAYKSKPTGTYTNKKSRTYVEDGKPPVTIMSMEKDGNKIEDKLIAGKLVERKVNGKVEQIVQHKQVAN